MKIIILGPPGSGKGTQSKILSKKLNLFHISVGDILRNLLLKKSSEDILKIKNYICDGKLLPDRITNNVVLNFLKNKKFEKGYILDGFPRTIIQAKAYNNYLKLEKTFIDLIIVLETSNEVIIERILNRFYCSNCGSSFNLISNPSEINNICNNCGNILIKRKDDAKKIIIERINIYNKKINQILEYYDKKNFFICKIKGDFKIKEITKKIFEYIERIF